jgi:hypothetical protein
MRFTVRRLMCVAALVAAMLAVGLEWTRLARKTAARRQYAASCAASEALARKFAVQYSQHAKAIKEELAKLRSHTFLDTTGIPARDQEALHQLAARRFSETWERTLSLTEDKVATYDRNAGFWGSMRRKYERAARWPWRVVEPDPPPPI